VRGRVALRTAFGRAVQLIHTTSISYTTFLIPIDCLPFVDQLNFGIVGASSKSTPLTRRQRGPLLLTPQAGGRGRLPSLPACIRRAYFHLSTVYCTQAITYRYINDTWEAKCLLVVVNLIAGRPA
jgi:hypothetical protein